MIQIPVLINSSIKNQYTLLFTCDNLKARLLVVVLKYHCFYFHHPYAAVQKQNTISAYFAGEQILPFSFNVSTPTNTNIHKYHDDIIHACLTASIDLPAITILVHFTITIIPLAQPRWWNYLVESRR